MNKARIKICILLIMILAITGCVNIQKTNYEIIINETVNSRVHVYNTYRNGYKLYLPHGLYVDDSNEYNEIIRSSKYKYYLYIDVTSYLSKKNNSYSIDEDSYYSILINSGDKKGYLEINEKNNKYLVEIVYNYAKIEVMVDKRDINEAVTNAMVVLTSVHYNDSVLKNLADETTLNYKDENVDIFKSKSNGGSEKSNFLEYVEEYDPTEDELPDYDLIK